MTGEGISTARPVPLWWSRLIMAAIPFELLGILAPWYSYHASGFAHHLFWSMSVSYLGGVAFAFWLVISISWIRLVLRGGDTNRNLIDFIGAKASQRAVTDPNSTDPRRALVQRAALATLGLALLPPLMLLIGYALLPQRDTIVRIPVDPNSAISNPAAYSQYSAPVEHAPSLGFWCVLLATALIMLGAGIGAALSWQRRARPNLRVWPVPGEAAPQEPADTATRAEPPDTAGEEPPG